MQHWLVKTEPDTYAWATLVKEQTGVWDGVRNFQARSNMKAMKKGDLVFVYHTGDEKAIVGTAKVSREAYPEPKDKDWVAVDLTAEKPLKRPITLAEIKADKNLSDMVLVRASRLSVQPVKADEFAYIIAKSQH
jgi:predicted RNA-binding protein with PUA-like domain